MKQTFKNTIRPGRVGRGAVFLLLLAAAFSCNGSPLFESTNIDPHPPTLLNFEYSPATVFAPPADIPPTVRVDDDAILRGTFDYVDPGGDIIDVLMLDTSGKHQGKSFIDPKTPRVLGVDENGLTLVVKERKDVLALGTSGTVTWEVRFIPQQAGLHVVRVWLLDSKGSESNAVEFEVTVIPRGQSI